MKSSSERSKYLIKKFLIIILIFSCIILDCIPNRVAAAIKTSDTQTRGNTTSNINNGGYLANDEEWLYYINEGKLEQVPGKFEYQYTIAPGIFAKRLDDTGEPLRVTDTITDKLEENITNLNVIDGWIYYMTDRVMKKDPETGYPTLTEQVIVRNKADGSGKGQVIYATGDTSITDLRLIRFLVVDGYIYYSVKGIMNDSTVRYIYRMKTDGKSNTRLTETANTCFDVKGEWLYFVQGGGITRKKLTEKNKKETVYSPPFDTQEFFIDADWIYLKAHTIIIKVPLKKNVKTSEVKQLVSIVNMEESSDIFMVDRGWLYYNIRKGKWVQEGEFQNYIESDTFYRIKIDGKSRKKICAKEDFWFTDLQIVNDYLYSVSSMRSLQPATVRLKISELK